eukprot:6212421-Pleurochrysis_carterae.AAC.4
MCEYERRYNLDIVHLFHLRRRRVARFRVASENGRLDTRRKQDIDLPYCNTVWVWVRIRIRVGVRGAQQRDRERGTRERERNYRQALCITTGKQWLGFCCCYTSQFD